MKNAKKTVMVLGAGGQLGSDLCRVLRERNFEVFAVTREQLNAEDANLPQSLRSLSKSDFIINCVADVRVDDCEDHPDRSFRLNSSFAYQLARFCQERGTTLFHISTDFVFDGAKGAPYQENEPISPLNIYGLSKAAGELAVRRYCERHFIFRVSCLFGVSGSSGKGGNFIETMISAAKQGKPLRVVGDQFTVPTHTLDVARSIRHFIETGVVEYGTYHCVSSGSVSWFGFAKAIFESLGISPEVSAVATADYPVKARRPLFSVLDNSKLSRFYSMPDWSAALGEYLAAKGHLPGSAPR